MQPYKVNLYLGPIEFIIMNLLHIYELLTFSHCTFLHCLTFFPSEEAPLCIFQRASTFRRNEKIAHVDSSRDMIFWKKWREMPIAGRGCGVGMDSG